MTSAISLSACLLIMCGNLTILFCASLAKNLQKSGNVLTKRHVFWRPVRWCMYDNACNSVKCTNLANILKEEVSLLKSWMKFANFYKKQRKWKTCTNIAVKLNDDASLTTIAGIFQGSRGKMSDFLRTWMSLASLNKPRWKGVCITKTCSNSDKLYKKWWICLKTSLNLVWFFMRDFKNFKNLYKISKPTLRLMQLFGNLAWFKKEVRKKCSILASWIYWWCNLTTYTNHASLQERLRVSFEELCESSKC